MEGQASGDRRGAAPKTGKGKDRAINTLGRLVKTSDKQSECSSPPKSFPLLPRLSSSLRHRGSRRAHSHLWRTRSAFLRSLGMPQVARTSSKNVDEKEASAKAQEQEFKRARGAISCAECRRLKLKCDKTVPCSSCKRRGCASICPNGSLTTGQGTR